MEEQVDIINAGDLGGTMRLGLYEATLSEGSIVEEVYGSSSAFERHRHRYEVNNGYRDDIAAAGLVFSGTSPDGQLVEFVELPREVHPYYVSTQAHPELRSRPTHGHPLFVGLIAAAKELANESKIGLTICTFDPHPNVVVRPDQAPKLIGGISQRKQLLLRNGVDHVEVIAFTPEFANLSPRQFSEDFLKDRLNAQVVVVGRNFTYGRRAGGNVDSLVKDGNQLGFSVKLFDLVQSDGTISSTRIRELILSGNVSAAAELLGRYFSLDGQVVQGDQRGRELGYPTANVEWDEALIVPADGVYAGYVNLSGDRLPAAISVGTNPQFEGNTQRVEAYVLNRTDLDLYGAHIGVEFVDLMRPQAVFGTLDEYLTQIALDVAAIAQRLGV
jgi:riboflavin kinase/FMN adenylyltransferase